LLQSDFREIKTDINIKGSLLIFNRWGDEIYSNSDYKGNWPTVQPNLTSGVYYYVFYYSKCFSKGWIQLIR
jgi:hypothetical protein